MQHLRLTVLRQLTCNKLKNPSTASESGPRLARSNCFSCSNGRMVVNKYEPCVIKIPKRENRYTGPHNRSFPKYAPIVMRYNKHGY